MPASSCSRRDILRAALAGSAALGVGSFRFPADAWGRQPTQFPPTRVITQGPKHHWFGYYDKWQFDPTSRYVCIDVPHGNVGRQLHLIDIRGLVH